jgi:preprotein translocase subunit SecD
MMAVSLSEIVIVLGITAGRVTIDLPFIAGIIATIGTGIDAQIIMLDEAMRKAERIETLREKLSRAFFIIFGSAGTVIAAMLPLMFLGFGLLQGFAIVTIIGVLSGILITRPAFGAIIEKIVKV